MIPDYILVAGTLYSRTHQLPHKQALSPDQLGLRSLVFFPPKFAKNAVLVLEMCSHRSNYPQR